MREQVSQSKKATTSFSIPTLKQPTRGFGLESLDTAPQATTEVESVNPILTHDIRRISLRPQAKLSISQPGDFYEQQADSVAQQVMRRMAQPVNRQSIQRQQASDPEDLQMKSVDNFHTSWLQRQQAPEEEELQMKPLVNTITPLVQRQQAPDPEDLQMKSVDNSHISWLQRQQAPEEEELPEDTEVQDEDHKNEGGSAAEEKVNIDELNLNEIKKDDVGLKNFFKIFVQDVENGKYSNLQDNTELYNEWYDSGVKTRDGFKKLLNKCPTSDGNNLKRHSESDINNSDSKRSRLQMQRNGNTISYQKEYNTDNYGKFEEITYTRDGVGNINFSNVTKQGTWQDPVNGQTNVQLNKGLRNKQYGLTKRGMKIHLATSSREQHFSIANRIMGYSDAGSPDNWTWHHKTTKYEMVLVDRQVHRKHGHNGGILLWK